MVENSEDVSPDRCQVDVRRVLAARWNRRLLARPLRLELVNELIDYRRDLLLMDSRLPFLKLFLTLSRLLRQRALRASFQLACVPIGYAADLGSNSFLAEAERETCKRWRLDQTHPRHCDKGNDCLKRLPLKQDPIRKGKDGKDCTQSVLFFVEA